MLKKSNKIDFKPSDTDYANSCIVSIYSDKKGFKISTNLLEDLFNESKKNSKNPLLILSLRKSDTEMYVLKCSLEINRR